MIYYSRIVVSELPHYRAQHDNNEQVSDSTESPEETTESDTTDENEADTNTDSDSNQPSEQQNDRNEKSDFLIIPIVIGSLLVLAVIAIIILKRKNIIKF